MSHLTEEQLNLYLDDQLPAGQRASVEMHLADCDDCRAELAALQALFTALDTLSPEPLATDLTPSVLNEIARERQGAARRRRISWLLPALQGVAIILILVLGWSVLATRYDTLARLIPTEPLSAAWTDALTRGDSLWTATIAWWQAGLVEPMLDVLDLPATLGQAIGQWPQLPGLGLTVPQALAIGLGAAMMWLVGNSILLRTTAGRLGPSRHLNHQ